MTRSDPFATSHTHTLKYAPAWICIKCLLIFEAWQYMVLNIQLGGISSLVSSFRMSLSFVAACLLILFTDCQMNRQGRMLMFQVIHQRMAAIAVHSVWHAGKTWCIFFSRTLLSADIFHTRLQFHFCVVSSSTSKQQEAPDLISCSICLQANWSLHAHRISRRMCPYPRPCIC